MSMSYKLHHQPLAGESYVRCHQVVIDNALGRAPTLTFHRQRVIGSDAGAVSQQPLPPRLLAFDPAASVALVDPESGEDTGHTITHAEIYAAIYSAFIAVETATPDTEEAIT
jgi:hypothetical protein